MEQVITTFDGYQQKVQQSAARALAAEVRGQGLEADNNFYEEIGKFLVGKSPLNSKTIDEKCQKVFGKTAPFALVAFDANRIQNWVFDTSRPAVIGGSSRLLDDVGMELRKPNALNCEQWGGFIYAGGGNCLALASASIAEKLENDLKDFVEHNCSGLTVTTAHVTVWPSGLIAGRTSPLRHHGLQAVMEVSYGLSSTLGKLHARLRKGKERTLPYPEVVNPAPDSGRSRHSSEGRCQCCFIRQATTDIDRPEQRKLPACKICKIRWDAWRDRSKTDKTRNLSFSDIAEKSHSRRKYISLLIADGNSMGKAFQLVDRLDRLAALSGEVTRIFDKARRRPIEELGLEKSDEQFALSLLSGGDEVVIILPGDRGLRSANLVIETIHREVEKSLQSGILGQALAEDATHIAQLKNKMSEFSVGVGLVIAGPKMPIRHLRVIGEELERSAKKLKPQSAVDFEVLTGGSMLPRNIEALRNFLSLEKGGLLRTCKPFNRGDFGDFLQRINNSSQVPKSQLYLLREGVGQGGREVFLNHVLYQVARNKALKEWVGKFVEISPRNVEQFFVTDVKVTKQYSSVRPEHTCRVWIDDLLEAREFDLQSNSSLSSGSERS